MKKLIYNLIRTLCIAAITMLSSCESFLDLKPISIPVGPTYWQTENDANAAVLGSYLKLRECLGFGGGLRFFTYGDFTTQLFSDQSEWGRHEFTGHYEYAANGAIADWSPFYKVILAANVAIENIDKMPLSVFGGKADSKNSYIGEALFVRAYTYFYMVRIWGTVPMLLEPVEDASEAVYDQPLSTESEILSQCITDLKTADSYLSWESTGKKIRANRASVNALMAHVYMWRTRANQDVIDKSNFKNAIDCIEQIEANSGAALVDGANLPAIWKGESSESLFEFSFKIADKEGFRKNEGFADRFLGYPYNTDRKIRPIFGFSNDFLSLYRERARDFRIQKLFENFTDVNSCFTTKYNQIQYTNAEKTDWETEGAVVIFRLADMYLLKAEALLMKENPEPAKARVYLNYIRQRAGLDDYAGVDANLYEEISDERARELFLEGHRLYDWVRTGFYVAKSGGNYTLDRYKREGYLFPVNVDLIIKNRYVKQTPYWADKMFL